MRKYIFFIISLCSASYFTCAYGLQVKAVKDNETLFFKISTKEYSRIFVAGDRIISIKGKNNFYEIKEFKGKYDEGVLYIRPASFYQNKPFSVFITTETGHHFTLFLSAIDVPSENIEIKPISASKMVAIRWEENLPYTQSIIELMRAMRNSTQPEGYAVINLGKTQPKRMNGNFTMQLLTLYRGGFLEGEIWCIKNDSGHTIYLHPRDFYQDNVRAASILNETLRNGEETLLYRIVSHE